MIWFVAIAVGESELPAGSIWDEGHEHRVWLIRASDVGRASQLAAQRVLRSAGHQALVYGVEVFLIDMAAAVTAPRATTEKVYSPAKDLPSTRSSYRILVGPNGIVKPNQSYQPERIGGPR